MRCTYSSRTRPSLPQDAERIKGLQEEIALMNRFVNLLLVRDRGSDINTSPFLGRLRDLKSVSAVLAETETVDTDSAVLGKSGQGMEPRPQEIESSAALPPATGRIPPPAQSSLEFELMALHPSAYPTLVPVEATCIPLEQLVSAENVHLPADSSLFDL
jgi:hypothetical protein